MAEDKKEPESNKAASTAAPPAKEGVSQTGNGASSGTDDAAADSGEGEEPCPKVSKDSTAKDARRHATPYAKKDEPADATADGGAATQNCRVYVGNLSWSTGWRDLKDHMKACGDVLRADIMQTHDGRSKGCGIVEYSSPEEAARAVEELNNSELSGRQIFVREDREQTTGGGGGGGGGGGSNEDGQSKRVYVGNLSWDVAWQDLKDHMRTVGDVAYSEVMTDHDGRSKGCGIVEFTTAAGAKEAIAQLTDTELKGRMIFVREDREQGGGGHGGGGFQQGGGGWHQSGGRGGGGGHHGGGSLSVYVGNLAYETSWQDLKDHMRAAGNVDKVSLVMVISKMCVWHLSLIPIQLRLSILPNSPLASNPFRPTSSKEAMAAPKAAESFSTKSPTKPNVPSVNSKTRNSTDVPSLSVRIASKVAEAEVPTTVTAAVGSTTNVPTIPPTCKEAPPRKDVSSLLATSPGRLVGGSSKITFVSVARLIVLRLQRVTMGGRGDLDLLGSIPQRMLRLPFVS